MSGPYCESCKHFRPTMIGRDDAGECSDPAKRIYFGSGMEVNCAPDIDFPKDMTCNQHEPREAKP